MMPYLQFYHLLVSAACLGPSLTTRGQSCFLFFSFWWGSGAQLTSNEVICIDKGVSHPRGQWIILGLWVDLCNVK